MGDIGSNSYFPSACSGQQQVWLSDSAVSAGRFTLLQSCSHLRYPWWCIAMSSSWGTAWGRVGGGYRQWKCLHTIQTVILIAGPKTKPQLQIMYASADNLISIYGNCCVKLHMVFLAKGSIQCSALKMHHLSEWFPLYRSGQYETGFSDISGWDPVQDSQIHWFREGNEGDGDERGKYRPDSLCQIDWISLLLPVSEGLISIKDMFKKWLWITQFCF